MGLFKRMAGVVSNFFQVGGPAGPAVKNNSGAIEARNAADSAFAVVRGATPVGDDDLVTKRYADTLAYALPITLQFNGNSALPSNTGTEQYYVVTTTGPNATIGQLLWDDGTGVGTVTVIPAKIGNTIVTTAAFSGGTISLATNQEYVWSGAAWVNIAPNVSGAVFEVRFAITNAASQSSTTQISASAVVLRAYIDVVTPYSANATIQVGQTGTAGLLMATGDSFPTVAGIYDADQDTAWGGSALAVLVTVGGTPAAGAGFCGVVYTIPNP